MKSNHQIIFLLTTLFVFSCMVSCQAQKQNGKLKKPVFVASNEESEIIDIKATDNYDSLSFKMEVDDRNLIPVIRFFIILRAKPDP